MLTIFTTPKPFRGHIGVIQTNAVQSWLLLHPECEVILFGSEEGTAEVASRFGIRHIADIECSEYGTPLVSSIFSIAQNIAKYQLMCYVNADIILMSDFLSAVQRIHKYPFLMVGQRWDLELNELLNFNDTKWEFRLRMHVAEQNKLHPKSGIDYFVFPRGLYNDIPPLAIGRSGWDNWLVYQARRLKVPVIDATKVITVVHQDHDYSHIPSGEVVVWKGPEAIRNLELTKGGEYALTLEHTTWILTSEGIRRALTMRHLYFRLEAVPVLFSYLHFLHRPMKALTRLIIYIRSVLGITEG